VALLKNSAISTSQTTPSDRVLTISSELYAIHSPSRDQSNEYSSLLSSEASSARLPRRDPDADQVEYIFALSQEGPNTLLGCSHRPAATRGTAVIAGLVQPQLQGRLASVRSETKGSFEGRAAKPYVPVIRVNS